LLRKRALIDKKKHPAWLWFIAQNSPNRTLPPLDFRRNFDSRRIRVLISSKSALDGLIATHNRAKRFILSA
jgi:hypothetical protein